MRGGLGLGIAGLIGAVVLALSAPIALTQDALQLQSPILVVESDRLYFDSLFYQRVAREITVAREALEAENAQIAADLESEELDLTERRAEISPDDFRTLADAFDEKVRRVRQAQDIKARALLSRQEQGRAEFLTAAAPVLEEMMREAGTVVILERREVFLSLNAIDVTERALARIDARLGDGTSTPPVPQD